MMLIGLRQFLFNARLLITEIPPRLNSLLPVILPRLQVLLENLLCDLLLLSFCPFLPLVRSIHAFEVLLALFDFFKKLLAHVLHLNVESLFGKIVQADCLPARVFFLPLIFNPLLCLAHYSLIDATLFRVHQLLISLLQEVKSIRGFLVAALVRVDKDREHAKLLLYFFLRSLSSDLKDVVGVHECSAQKSLQLIFLSELVIL